MPGEGPGRHLPTVAESLVWEQRIHKEEHYNARQIGKFSVRNCVSVLDVPAKFKPGHIDPVKDDKGLQRFDPADNGWNPESHDAREFRRCLNSQSAGPRDRQAYPMTTAQEHGWALAPQGNPVDRVRSKKNRMGIGWEFKHPSDWSESTAMAPPVLTEHTKGDAGERADGASHLSAAPPPPPPGGPSSRLSAAPPASVLSNSPPAQLLAAASAARASQLSATAPTELSGASASTASCLSRATSLPAIGAHPAERLHRQEKRLTRAINESARYFSRGDRGQLYARPLGMTDATRFDNDFTKAAGVPLYKTIGSQEVKLKNPNGTLASKWR